MNMRHNYHLLTFGEVWIFLLQKQLQQGILLLPIVSTSNAQGACLDKWLRLTAQKYYWHTR